MMTIHEAETAAKTQANLALVAAREDVAEARQALAPVARSPLFGNGIATALRSAVKDLDDLDDRLQRLQRSIHVHFNPTEEPTDD